MDNAVMICGRYGLGEFLAQHEHSIRAVMEKVASQYPDDLRYEICVTDSRTVSLTVYACKYGVRMEVAKPLCLMRQDLMADLFSAAIDATMREEPFDPPEDVKAWIYNEMWKCVPRDDLPVVEYSQMPQKLC